MAFGRIELLKKFSGKKIVVTTRCGLFRETTGMVKDVFDDFFVLYTLDERAGSGTSFSVRNMIMLENLAVITQLAEVETEALEIVR